MKHLNLVVLYDETGNRIKATRDEGGALFTAREVTTYEYSQTDRNAPNVVLFDEIYFPTRVY